MPRKKQYQSFWLKSIVSVTNLCENIYRTLFVIKLVFHNRVKVGDAVDIDKYQSYQRFAKQKREPWEKIARRQRQLKIKGTRTFECRSEVTFIDFINW